MEDERRLVLQLLGFFYLAGLAQHGRVLFAELGEVAVAAPIGCRFHNITKYLSTTFLGKFNGVEAQVSDDLSESRIGALPVVPEV